MWLHVCQLHKAFISKSNGHASVRKGNKKKNENIRVCVYLMSTLYWTQVRGKIYKTNTWKVPHQKRIENIYLTRKFHREGQEIPPRVSPSARLIMFLVECKFVQKQQPNCIQVNTTKPKHIKNPPRVFSSSLSLPSWCFYLIYICVHWKLWLVFYYDNNSKFKFELTKIILNLKLPFLVTENKDSWL